MDAVEAKHHRPAAIKYLGLAIVHLKSGLHNVQKLERGSHGAMLESMTENAIAKTQLVIDALEE